MSNVLILEKVTTLNVSAASGCLFSSDRLCIVADDDQELYLFDVQGNRTGSVLLFPEQLPESTAERKKAKADLEALCQTPQGQLLAIGSGSTPSRCRGAVIDSHSWTSNTIDASALYHSLATQIVDLNIEGAAFVGESLFLGQRGNGKGRLNALIQLTASTVLDELEDGRLSARSIERIIPLALGNLDGVLYTLTDLSPAADDGLWFTAAAEDTDDPYLDGEVTGALIGKMDLQGNVLWQRTVSPLVKLEGICRGADGYLYLVCDADDPDVPSPLFRVWIDEPQ